ncbi:MAG: hypothetical protein GQF41_1035 [Candidatus Rifleibacterium amylolyticum]|nr:MAG: hypothetical protein GQF41_1035 [Candidatus Rifleibacterium amylolyticum]
MNMSLPLIFAAKQIYTKIQPECLTSIPQNHILLNRCR